MLDSENAATGKFRNLGEQRWAVQLFRGTVPVAKRVEDADGIELGVGFPDQALDVVLVVPTMIIPSIGKNQQGTLGVMCTPHLAETQIDGVQERRAATRGGHQHAALQVFHAVGKRAGKFGSFVEGHQKELVLRIRGLKELQRGFARLVDLVGHAAAEIENHADGDGHIFGGKGDDLLLDVVLKYAEIVLLEAGNETVEGIGDRYINQGQVHIRADQFAWAQGDWRCVVKNFIQLGGTRQGTGLTGIGGRRLLSASKAQGKKKKQAGNYPKSTWKEYARLAPIAFHGFSIPPR